MNEKYEPRELEPRWQQRWESKGVFSAGRQAAPKGKKYVLEMLPYPSGKMHMGHVRNYLLGDVYARYYRMLGYDVVHPMGWDAFGLPAENAAIKDGVHPATRTAENIASFKAEMRSLGYAYDWALEVDTSKPEYYRWNQWFFVKMLELRLVYRRFSKVNWCTGCLTVIANEQVKDGKCERCDSAVVDKEMPEWAFRITKYSAALLDALDGLKEWPDRITAAQRNWIGRSEGVEVDFGGIRIFTTRVDTIHGCTYLVLAPEHPMVEKLATLPEVAPFVAKMKAKSKIERTAEGAEKEGVFTGATVTNPANGEQVPVWIANFVLADYGTGAVMSVPAHDERDFQFAKKYGLPIKVAIAPAKEPLEAAYTDDGQVIAAGNMPSAEFRKQEGPKLGKSMVTWRQKDWGFSRQRYWGTPIPIVYCEKCDPKREGIPVPIEQLPVVLPQIDTQAVLTGKGEPPLAKVPSWVNTTCPKCGGPARRETETMDTFVDSTWYFARYLTPHFDTAPFDAEVAKKYLPVDIYVGGPEHATMHLLYFRFWYRVMRELGLVQGDEPVKRLITQGIVNGEDGRKMSKRWGNVKAPSEIVGRYGADTARLYVLFAGPPQQDFDWSDKQVEGAARFLKRVWALAFAREAKTGSNEASSLEIKKATHKAIKHVTEAIERLSFNTAIAGTMEFVNTLYLVQNPDAGAMREAVLVLARLLTPFAPHIADELNEAYGGKKQQLEEPWPQYDPALVVDDVIPYAVQINGKLKSEIRVPLAAAEAEVRAAAEADEKVKAALAGKTLRKFVFVPKRLVNFVVG